MNSNSCRDHNPPPTPTRLPGATPSEQSNGIPNREWTTRRRPCGLRIILPRWRRLLSNGSRKEETRHAMIAGQRLCRSATRQQTNHAMKRAWLSTEVACSIRRTKHPDGPTLLSACGPYTTGRSCFHTRQPQSCCTDTLPIARPICAATLQRHCRNLLRQHSRCAAWLWHAPEAPALQPPQPRRRSTPTVEARSVAGAMLAASPAARWSSFPSARRRHASTKAMPAAPEAPGGVLGGGAAFATADTSQGDAQRTQWAKWPQLAM